MIQKAFTVGNSVVLTVPPKSGIKPGMKLRYKGRRKNTLEYEIVMDSYTKSDKVLDNYPESISGALKLDVHMTGDELIAAINELKEDSYDSPINIS